mmetsp:Transcript_23160/g.60547  ORF Transcript_23160/g.60547 Transcript_23160/m.60547 type:complete len:576 (-) Transcript_23160:1018-2745(-)
MQASFGLERLLDRITAPGQASEDWDLINDFCKQVKTEGEGGAAGVVQILLEKMRSKNEDTALFATTTLEAVVKACGLPIHQIVGKFRFLNELIKMVSPKYYANTPVSVKNRIYALFTQWNFSLVDQPKVRDAYQMLMKQGVTFPEGLEKPELKVKCGDGYMEVNAAAMTRRVSPLEEDKKKAVMLEKLLKSKDPSDLMKANKLIKKMVELDAKKNEVAARIRTELKKVKTNAKVLSDMLQHFSPESDGPLEKSEVIQDLYKSCQAMRPQMFKLAGDLDQKEDVLSEVLQANDDLTRVMDMYTMVKEKQAALPKGGATAAAQPAPQSDSLLDFGGLGGGAAAPSAAAPSTGGGVGDLLGMLSAPSSAAPTSDALGLGGLLAPAPAAAQPAAPAGDMFGLGSLGGLGAAMPSAAAQPPAAGLLGLGGMGGALQPAAATEPPSLDQVNVNMASVQPGEFPPALIYDKNQLRAQIFFAKDSPHPCILVAVCSFTNFGQFPVTDLLFQAAVPKGIEVKLLPPTGNMLPPANPMGGNQPISQLMLIRNAAKADIKLRYKLMFKVNGQAFDEMSDVSHFPKM